MTRVLSVDIKALTLITNDGISYALWPHEYWILCPKRTFWVPTDGKVHWSDFGILRHNAKLSGGLVLAQHDLLNGIDPASTKRGKTKIAEDMLENIRKEKYPTLPSRLRCHYLNHEKSTAERRSEDWKWQTRSLERCYLVRNGGYFHHADVTIYEKLALNPFDENLANAYWQIFRPRLGELDRLEVLANSSLYFPDWENFPEINTESLVRWSEYNSM